MIWHLPGEAGWSATPFLHCRGSRVCCPRSSPSIEICRNHSTTGLDHNLGLQTRLCRTNKTCVSVEIALFLTKRLEKSFVPPFSKIWWHWISWRHLAGLFPMPKSRSGKYISFPAHYRCPNRHCFRKAVGRQTHPSGLQLSRDFGMDRSKVTLQCSCPEKDQTVPKLPAKSGWWDTVLRLAGSEWKGRPRCPRTVASKRSLDGRKDEGIRTLVQKSFQVRHILYWQGDIFIIVTCLSVPARTPKLPSPLHAG